MRRRWRCAPLGVLAVGVASALASGQIVTAQKAAPQTPAIASDSGTDGRSTALNTDQAAMTRLVADRLTRNALIYLRQLKDPTLEDYQITALTLQTALELEPLDAELVRFLLEARYAAGDEEGVLDATRRLIRLDPDDTVAQLRLISSRIDRLQDVEARQQVYDRLLDEGAGALDPSIRSRLALDDALLARELGDDERFIDRLTMATQLDATNKPAAVLAATYTLDRLDDPLARVEMLANVVLADPLDPATHLGLADELFSHGAYRCAQRFYQNALYLRRVFGKPASSELNMRVLLISWTVNGANSLIDLLDEGERSARYAIRKSREAAKLAGDDTNAILGYHPITINETLRLAAGVAIGDDVEAQQGLDRLERISAAAIDALKNPPAPKDDGATPTPDADQIASGVRRWRVSMLWYRLWSGLELDKAAATIDELAPDEADGLITHEAMERFRGLLAAQQGDAEAAVKLLTPLAKDDPRARIGLGIAAEKAQDVRTALRQYARLALEAPGSMLGVWARTRVETLLGQPLEPTSVAQSLSDYCDSLPQEIDRMVAEPRAMLHLSAEQVEDRLQPFDRIEVRIKVRNVSPIPLAIGPDAPISSNLLLSPRLTLGSKQITKQLKPEVISFNRRLRLKPRESLESVVWAGQGQTGALFDQTLTSSALFRWRVVEGFSVTSDGEYAPTLLSLTADTDVARRPPVEPPKGGVMVIPQRIEDSSGLELLKMLVLAPSAVRFANQQAGEEFAKKLLNNIASATLQRAATMTTLERVMLTQLAPTAAARPEFRSVEDFLRSDDNRLVRLAYLYTRVSSPDDRVFTLAAEGDDALVAQVAQRLRQRLVEAKKQAAPGKP